ncbi:LacI family DNA-binding transcriptional regulator [Agrobacterium sp. 22-226-1]
MKNKQVKLADIAKAAGVSQGTASNVFSRPGVVRDEVREHVLRVAKELGYRGPDLKGRLLRAGRVNAIGVASVEPLSYFFEDQWARSLMTAISEVCDVTGTGIALVSAQNQEKLAWNINSALVDGFILLCVEGGERLVELTRQRRLPFIALALGHQDATIPQIGIDNKAGAVLAARHIGELGHRRVAVLAVANSSLSHGALSPEHLDEVLGVSMRDRMIGYWQGLEVFGVRRDDVSIYGTLNDRPTVETALTTLFSQPRPPTAILAMSDRIAMFAIQWLSKHDISVPSDVSVVGFDGVPEGAILQPGLTTIAQPLQELAQKAVNSILESATIPQRVALEVNLIVRGSTSRPCKGPVLGLPASSRK